MEELALTELKSTHGLTRSRRAMNDLVDDIRQNGILESVKYVAHQGVNYVVDGRHRMEAATRLGLIRVPVQRVELPYLGYRTPADFLWTRR